MSPPSSPTSTADPTLLNYLTNSSSYVNEFYADATECALATGTTAVICWYLGDAPKAIVERSLSMGLGQYLGGVLAQGLSNTGWLTGNMMAQYAPLALKFTCSSATYISLDRYAWGYTGVKIYDEFRDSIASTIVAHYGSMFIPMSWNPSTVSTSSSTTSSALPTY